MSAASRACAAATHLSVALKIAGFVCYGMLVTHARSRASKLLCMSAAFCVASSVLVVSLQASAKAPLVERVVENQQQRDTSHRWVRQAEKPTRAFVNGSQTPLSVSISAKAAGKRGRDACDPSLKKQQHAKGWSPERSKRSRSMSDINNSEQNVKWSSEQNGRSGRPRLNRCVGGIAPNGNPQCWFAPNESEGDPHRVAQRCKQIEYGKNSAGYKAFIAEVPKCVVHSPIVGRSRLASCNLA